jgi:hypothetical protein
MGSLGLQPFNPNAFLAAFGFVFGVGFIGGLVLLALLCWYVSDFFKKIPLSSRSMDPGLVWLLMIPCFNLYWNFQVFPGLAKSYQAYFRSRKDQTNGDCGETVGMWLSITLAGCYVPCFNVFFLPTSLVLLLVYLLKMGELKAKIKLDA